LAAQLLVIAGAAVMRLPIVSAQAMVMLTWSALASLLALAADRRIALAALGYLAAFFVIAALCHDRREATYVMSGAHLLTTLTVFTIWRPRR
ncbi:MAG TPA: hypothetical protein VFB62_17335, partial [Polyangiaceae bacterium]|nr:hypothetical protein [Polyangiaceae bacterium]